MVKIQPTRIADRIFTDKPPNLGIIVPIAIVVQPCFVIVVLALKSDRVGVLFQRSTYLLSFLIQYVACRVAGEGFHTQPAGGISRLAIYELIH